jgi:hypothetical protein
VTALHLTQRNGGFAQDGNLPMVSSTLHCATLHGPLPTKMTGGVYPSHLLARGAQLPFCKEKIAVLPGSILQAFLDRIGQAVLAERFEEYRELVQLPLHIQTTFANLVIRTEDELVDGFDAYTEMLQSHGVTEMIRPVKSAAFQGNEHIVGLYETRLMRGTHQVMPSFQSKMWIVCADGIWKAIKIHNTTKETRWPMLLAQPPSDTWPSEET